MPGLMITIKVMTSKEPLTPELMHTILMDCMRFSSTIYRKIGEQCSYMITFFSGQINDSFWPYTIYQYNDSHEV